MTRSTLLPSRIPGAAIIALAIVLGLTSLSSAVAQCPDVPGDLDASGDTNVVDVQCAILIALNLLSDEGFPGCLVATPEEADINCDATWDITDVVLSVNIALQMWPVNLDNDANGCIDACEEPACACLNVDCSELCNGLDDNCDGKIDEGLNAKPCESSNSNGTCSGTQTCLGTLGWAACNAPLPFEELCNGEDDNCDGKIDEGLNAKPCEYSNSNGTCSGTQTCLGTFGWTSCNAPLPISELCNGEDDNCDGKIDEGLAPIPCIKPGPFGICSGEKLCGGAQGWLPCDAPPASPEVFDGVDNNCDGQIDEGFVKKPHKVFALDGIHTELLYSIDNGDNWFYETDLPAPAPALVSITSSGDDKLYVVTSGQANPVYRSLNGGGSFEPAGIWPDKSNNAVVCAHPNLNIVYGTDSSGNIYRSFFNSAASFEWVGTWPTEGSSLSCVVTPSGTLYLIDAAYMGGPVYASTNNGASVSKKTNYGGKSGNLASIASDPGGNLFALDGENNVMLSIDGAETWTQVGTIPAGVQTAQSIATGGYGVLYAATPNPSNTGTGGRFFLSTDMGSTWTETSNWKGPDGPSGWVALASLPL